MSTLLIVHHTPSPAVQEMLEAVVDGANDDAIEGVDVIIRPALATTASDVLAADAYVLGTPANLGYMSGALKHFFDQIYYPCLSATEGRGYGLFVHGNNDTTGAVGSVQSVVKGLSWKPVAEPVCVVATPTSDDLAACRELGAVAAATLTMPT